MHIFSSLSYEELLSSCLHASTYNQKETVKALGHKMPREQILSRKWMGTVVCETVSVFARLFLYSVQGQQAKISMKVTR